MAARVLRERGSDEGGPKCGEYQNNVNMRVSDREQGFPSPAVPSRAGARTCRRGAVGGERVGGGCVGQGAGVEGTDGESWREQGSSASSALLWASRWLGPPSRAPAAELLPAACHGIGLAG